LCLSPERKKRWLIQVTKRISMRIEKRQQREKSYNYRFKTRVAENSKRTLLVKFWGGGKKRKKSVKKNHWGVKKATSLSGQGNASQSQRRNLTLSGVKAKKGEGKFNDIRDPERENYFRNWGEKGSHPDINLATKGREGWAKGECWLLQLRFSGGTGVLMIGQDVSRTGNFRLNGKTWTAD